MSTTTTTIQEGELVKQPDVFITLIAVDTNEKPAGQPTKPTEKKEVPAFVLNSSDFISLQLYLKAGLQLPATNELFESRYPKTALDKYLKVDTTLYDGLKSGMVLTHKHCEEFEGRVVGPMITTGGEVSNFGEDCDRLVGDILSGIAVLTDKKVSSKDAVFDDAKASVKSSCKKIVRRAEELQTKCNTLVTQLSEFRAQTESDKTAMTDLSKRMKKVMPTEAEQDAELNSLLKKAEDLYNATRAELEATHNEAIEAGEDHWYYYIPIIGTCLLIYNIYKQGKLMDKIHDVETAYQEARERGGQDVLNLNQAFMTVNVLGADVDRILATIDGAISSVTNMGIAFSSISTTFSALRNRVTDVEGDIDDTTVTERLVAVDDLKVAQQKWKEVSTLAKAFQMHGGLLKFDQGKK